MSKHTRTFLACIAFAGCTSSDNSPPEGEPLTVDALKAAAAKNLPIWNVSQVSGISSLPSGCGVTNPSATNYPNSEVQPMVVADPMDPSHLVANFQQDRWSKFGGNGVVTYISRDFGLTWVPARTQSKFTMCTGGDYEVATDSWLSFGPDGTLFQVVFGVNLVSKYTTAIVVSRSTDGGDTWSDPVSLISDTDPRYFDDRPTVMADPKHPGTVYVLWDRVDDTSTATTEHWTQPFYLARSTDNGATWETPRNVHDSAVNSGTLGHQMVTLADGTLVDAFELATDTDATFQIIRSTDHGQTWSEPATVATMPDTFTIPDPDGGTDGIRNAALPLLAVGKDGMTLNATFVSGGNTGPVHVGFVQSIDGGLHWSTPINVDQTPAEQSSFLPFIAVTDDGRIGISYYDTRNNTSDPDLPTNVWLVTCDGNCTSAASWTEHIVLPSFDARLAPKTGFGYMLGDYNGLVGGFSGTFVTVLDRTWGDAGNPQNVVSAIVR